MFNLFNRTKATITSIQLPVNDWELDKDAKDVRTWYNPDRTMALSLHYFEVKPDLPTITDVAALREHYRNLITEANGGIIETNLMQLKGYNAVRTIFKVPQEPSGTTYLGGYTIPFKRCSYVIKIQAPELGTTGIRDSVMMHKLRENGTLQEDEQGNTGWMADPYDANHAKGRLMNKSEEAQYDAQFPKHALSLTRQLMADIEAGIKMTDELQKLPPFLRL